MRILKLLNKIILSILVIFLIFIRSSYSEEQPVDIWNIDKSKIDQSNKNDTENINKKFKNGNLNQISTLNPINLEPQSSIEEVEFDQNLNSKKLKFWDYMTQKILD